MKNEPFGWYAPAAKAVPALPATDAGLEFLVKGDDVSSLEPEPTAESYRECDRTSLEKLFGLEAAPEGRSSTSMAYEEMTTKVFGSSDPCIVDSRSSEPIAPPLEKGATTTTTETIGSARWTYFHRGGKCVRMRCADEIGELELDGEGNVIAA